MTWSSARLRRLFYGLRTEGAGTVRETLAVGLGVFIGCLPVYGFHLLLCWAIGSALGLNRLKVYLAANISNPLVAPWLVAVEIQVGAWMRRGSFHSLTPHSLTPRAIERAGLAMFGGDLLLGSLFVGGALAAAAAGWTYATRRGCAADGGFTALVCRASDRYVRTSVTAWEFARGKLRNDPVYRATLAPGVLASGGTLLDIGCGQGLTLALLAEAGRTFDAGAWPPDWPAPPRFERMAGVEVRHRVAALAREALEGDADIIDADARLIALDRARAIVCFDVLQLMRPAEQDALLAALAARLEPGGVMLVREVDASAGWRFTAVGLGNRLTAVACGRWRQEFHPRTAAGWRACFMRHGFRVDVRRMDEGTPFANVLFRLTAEPDASAVNRLRSPAA